MADRLTQLQDCMDELLTNMFASISYIQTYGPYGEILGQPSQAPQSASTRGNGDAPTTPVPEGNRSQQQLDRAATPPPAPTDEFDTALRAMAQGLVLKEQQIEYLINSLPGIGSSEADQVRRIREQEAELRAVEKQRAQAEEEKERLVEALGSIIVQAKRIT